MNIPTSWTQIRRNMTLTNVGIVAAIIGVVALFALGVSRRLLSEHAGAAFDYNTQRTIDTFTPDGPALQMLSNFALTMLIVGVACLGLSAIRYLRRTATTPVA